MKQGALQLIAAAAVVAAPLFAQTPDPENRARGDLLTLQRDVDALRAVRDRLAQRLPLKASVPLTFALQLEKFLSWPNRFGETVHGDLVFTVFRADGKSLATPASCSEWRGGAPSVVDVSGLRFDTGGVTGRLVVVINDLTYRAATVTVAVAASDSTLRGIYRADGSGGIGGPREAAVSGSVEAERTVLDMPSAPEVQDTWTLADEQYHTAQWLDATARVLYQDIRAHRLAIDGACSYPHACRLAMREQPIYPELPRLSAGGKVQREPKKMPSLDDALDDSVLGMETAGPKRGASEPVRAEATAAARAAGNAAVKEAAARNIAAIRELVGRRRAVAERAAFEAAPAYTVGSVDSGDPLFGPWYGQEPLPSSGAGSNVIPADAGTAGVPSWPWVSGWTCVGPLKRAERIGVETPQLPEVVPGTAFAYAVGSLRPSGKVERWPPAPAFTCAPGLVEDGTGFVRSPHLALRDDRGARRVNLPHTTLYAVTEVSCEAAKTLWVGVTVNDHGKLWINDRLVWVSPASKAARYNAGAYIFQAAFAKGVNRLMFRCDNDLDDSYFGVRICVRGQPRSAAEVAKAVAPAAPGAVAAGVHGWRYDGTGRYPDARPPLAWDAERGINVLWRVPLGFSHATPLVAGDLVVTFEEPDTVVALDKLTGAERWRACLDIAATRGAGAQAESAAARARAGEARAELARLGPGRRERVEALTRTGLDPAAAEARVKELEQQSRADLEFLKRLGVPQPGWYNDIGYTYATPVTDGKRLFVKLYTGALGCLDLDGKVQWIVDHGLVTTPKGTGEACPSPLLVNGQVIAFGPTGDNGPDAPAAEAVIDAAAAEADVPPPAPVGGSGRNAVRAFDAATGRLLWSTPLLVEDRFYFPGTPAPMRLTRGSEALDVIAVPNGSILRAADGRVLCRFAGAREQYGSPVAEGNVVCFASDSDKAAFELILVDRDTVGVKPLWNVDHPATFQDGNYGLFHEGKLFYSRPNLDATDLASGALLWVSDNIFFAQPGRGYPPVALAGGNLYAADNATWFQPTYRPGLVPFPGALSVVAPGVPGLVLARNRIEQTHGGFSFDGNRMYVRSLKSLMCYGHTGDAGRAYDAETVAAEVLGAVFSDKPRPDAPVAVTALAATGAKWASSTAYPLGVIRAWTAAGPFPAAAADELAAALRDPKWPGFVASEQAAPLSAAGVTRALRRLDTGNMPEWAADTRFDILKKENFKRGPHIGWEGLFGNELDLFRVIPAAEGAVAVLCTVLVNDYPRLARFDASHAGVSGAWLGGVAVRHGQCVELPAGPVPLALLVRLDAPAGERILLRPRLWPSAGPSADLAAWQAHIERCRPYLENVLARSPDSAVGKRAKALLAESR